MARTTSNLEPIAEYTGSFPDLEDLRATIADIWAASLEVDPQLRAQVGEQPPAVPFRLKLTQGGDLSSVTLGVLAATSVLHFGSMVLHDLWKSVFLPKLKRRYGAASFRESGRRSPAPTPAQPQRRKGSSSSKRIAASPRVPSSKRRAKRAPRKSG